MENIDIKNLFRASNCNSGYKLLKWIKNTNYVVFGSGNCINLVDFENNKLIYSVNEFTGNIKQIEIKYYDSIIYLYGISNEGEFITIMINKLYNYNIFNKENILVKIQKISLLSLLSITSIIIDNYNYFCFGDSNGNLFIYKYSFIDDLLNKIDEYNFGNNLINDLKFGKFNHTLYLFISLSDFKLHIYEFDYECNEINNNKYLFYNYSTFGHTNKIRSIEIKENMNNLDIITGGVDGSIRIWRISNENILYTKHSYMLNKEKNNFIFLYSVLSSHTESITHVDSFNINDYEIIISSSLDFTIQIWEKETHSNLFISNSRLGELVGNKNSFFGFDICLNDLKEYYLIGYTIYGSFYKWKIVENENYTNELEKYNFLLKPFISGHFNNVNDICWSTCGNFLASTSKDQTSRIWGEITNRDVKNLGYYELSRPQIHGYDINSICLYNLQNNKDDRKFCDLLICGADEKILRILEPNAYMINKINYLKNKNIHLYYLDQEQENSIIESENPLQYKVKSHVGGNVLGLLVKAVVSDKKNFYFDDGKDLIKNEIGKINFNKNENPNEDFLNQLSLWPENNKLFGHGNEISIVRASLDGRFLASASFSKNNKVFGSILIWDPLNYKIIQTIQSHIYTILDLCFSYDGNLMASVSKDRQLSIFEYNNNEFIQISLTFPHKRLINGVVISENNKKIFTCSRDKSIKSFKLLDKQLIEESILILEENLTCLTFIDIINDIYYLVVGSVSGCIYIIENKNNMMKVLKKKKIHGRQINQIKMNIIRKQNEMIYEIATCSNDHSITIFNL